MKKTLAILLALALVLCMMPSAAFAETIDFTGATISVSNDTEYNGTDQKPSVTVTLNGNTLKEGTDYTVAYMYKATESGEYAPMTAPLEFKDAGYYKITATGTNSGDNAYDGSKEAVYQIKPYDLATHKVMATVDAQVADADVLNSTVHYFADGKELTGASRSVISENVTLDNSNKANKVVGFVNKNNNLVGKIEDATYKTGTDISTATVVVSDKVYYDGTVKAPKTAVTITGVNSDNYDVTCDAVIKDAGSYALTIVGKKDYAGTKPATLEVKPRQANVYVSIGAINKQVEGKINVNPTLTDTLNGKAYTLVPGVDYNISTPEYVRTSSANTEIYKVTFNFINNYANYATTPISREFEVAKTAYDIANNADARLVTPAAYMYNGKAQPATVKVLKKGSTTTSFTNYTVEYRYKDATTGKTLVTTSPVDAKVYDVYVVGSYPYAGEISIGKYTIPQFTFANVDVSASQSSYANTPNVVVRALYDNIIFVKDKDYTVSNTWINSSSNKGYVTITSTGTGNLTTGSKSVTYSLIAKSISYCTTEFATGSKSTYQYTGSVIMPKVKVRDGYTVLTEGTDYSIVYKDASGKTVTPKEAGTYTIEIVGKGAYTGTTTMSFSIVGIDISGYTVTLKEDSVKADGLNKIPVILSVKNGYYTTLSSADYTVSYQDASGKTITSMKTPGTYKVVVTGKNGYSGSTYATFRIVGTPQEIKIAKTSYKVYKDSDSFKINATATGDGTGFSYVSSNPEVATVSATGVVTIHKIGRAKITVTTTGMKKSEPASDDVYVKVYPDKTKITQKPQTEGNKGSFRVRWEKQDDVTYYEIRYARNSKFTSGTYLTKKVNASTLNYTTQSTKISGLKSGAKYYVKVRAVKVVTNDYGQQLKYYGTWSNWRSVVTK